MRYANIRRLVTFVTFFRRGHGFWAGSVYAQACARVTHAFTSFFVVIRISGMKVARTTYGRGHWVGGCMGM